MKKLNLIKALSAAILLAVVACNNEETLSDLESSQQNGLSSKSIKLDIEGIEAEDEQSSNPASNAIDSDDESRWSGYGNPLDLILDLGRQQEIDFIKIAFHKGDDRKNSFYVYTSNNTSDWSHINSKTSSGNTDELQTFDLNNTEARYLRLEFLGNSDNDWNSITNIEVYGTGSNSETNDDETASGFISIPSIIQAENYVAQSGIKIETTSDNGGGENVGYIDEGDYLTYNIDVPNSGEYKVDFRVASKYNNSEFDVYQDDEKLTSINKEVTGGWQTWKTTSKTVSLDSGNQTIKVVATGGGWNLNWIEFSAYDEVTDDNEDSGLETPVITPVVNTGGSVEDILGDFWKITVPVDEDGNSSPLDCSEYDCRNNDAVDLYGLNEVAANNNYSDFFYESDGWAVFTAFCGGATTTNSQYPRSELRGLNEDGDDDYFDMEDHQELQVTVKVLEVPKERPEVNMVQIHGPDDEPLRVEYNDGSTGSDQGLHLTVNESSTLDDIMDYEIGQELKVWVKVEDRHLWIELDNLSTGEHYETDFEVEDKTGYWKVGCYLQSSITYCDVKSSGSFCSNGGQSDDYYATGSVAAKDLTLIRDGKVFK